MDPRCRERECEHKHHLLNAPAACPYMHSSQRVGLKRNFETETTNLFSEFSGREAEVAPVSSAPNPNYSLRSRSLAENLQRVPSPARSRCVHISPFVVSIWRGCCLSHTKQRSRGQQSALQLLGQIS